MVLDFSPRSVLSSWHCPQLIVFAATSVNIERLFSCGRILLSHVRSLLRQLVRCYVSAGGVLVLWPHNVLSGSTLTDVVMVDGWDAIE
ncbi:hypothetical protein BDR07DRAFT_1554527 [Suillus spraguei]|nr:hypothetical protein BDR07DRAFT_1320358 [Suillus spraguei]KAG2351454.1 hypothetical protein BDR07DRAFT_1319406 [Suillus spraguei]KAG2351510.1 hypothetical protein BDR07DRAFT_1318918 [Suillus spraguei]KAG2351716.1 hypothetical protein BDR07DRAFT_1317916 [Suillus spraguei]KAG2351730.1 hypothetical protein BDR07DRAFT_1317837 [Suillus spraguei]